MHPAITDRFAVPALHLEGTIRTAGDRLTVRLLQVPAPRCRRGSGIQVILRGYTKIHRGFSRQIFTTKMPPVPFRLI